MLKRILIMMFFIIIIYLFAMNLAYNVFSSYTDIQNKTIYNSSVILELIIVQDEGQIEIEQKAGLSDKSVAVITRERWYGKIIEIHGEKTNAKLFFFNILPLPLIINDENLKLVHIIFFSVIIYGSIFAILIYKYVSPNRNKDNKIWLNQQI